jgi:hypothetical protein
MTMPVDPDETQYEIDEIDLPASFDSTILEEELRNRNRQSTSPSRKRPHSPSISPPPELATNRHEDLGVPTGVYLNSDAYGASRFGEFGEYMRRKRQKQQVQDSDLLEGMTGGTSQSQIFRGVSIYVRTTKLSGYVYVMNLDVFLRLTVGLNHPTKNFANSF